MQVQASEIKVYISSAKCTLYTLLFWAKCKTKCTSEVADVLYIALMHCTLTIANTGVDVDEGRFLVVYDTTTYDRITVLTKRAKYGPYTTVSMPFTVVYVIVNGRKLSLTIVVIIDLGIFLLTKVKFSNFTIN